MFGYLLKMVGNIFHMLLKIKTCICLTFFSYKYIAITKISLLLKFVKQIFKCVQSRYKWVFLIIWEFFSSQNYRMRTLFELILIRGKS